MQQKLSMIAKFNLGTAAFCFAGAIYDVAVASYWNAAYMTSLVGFNLVLFSIAGGIPWTKGFFSSVVAKVEW